MAVMLAINPPRSSHGERTSEGDQEHVVPGRGRHIGSAFGEMLRRGGAGDLAGMAEAVSDFVGARTAILSPDGTVRAGPSSFGSSFGAATSSGQPHDIRVSRRDFRMDWFLPLGDARDPVGFLGIRPLPADVDADDWTELTEAVTIAVRLADSVARERAAQHRVALLRCMSDVESMDVGQPDPGHGGPCRLAVLTVPDGGRNATDAVGRMLRQLTATHRLFKHCEVTTTDDRIVSVYGCEPGDSPDGHAKAWRSMIDRLASASQTTSAVATTPGGEVATAGTLRVAVGAPTALGAPTRDAYRSVSRLAVLQADPAAAGLVPAVALVDELGPIGAVLDLMPARHAMSFVRRILGGLLGDPRFGGEMLDTLHAYLRAGGSPREAGRLLHLHESSVKYRMRVIREFLGSRLDETDTRFEIELAVRLLIGIRALWSEPSPLSALA